MKHKAQLSISRIGGHGDGYISVCVRDRDAGIDFLTLKMATSDFAECITGLGHVGCEMEFRGLQNVGKRIKRDSLEFELPDGVAYNNKTQVAVNIAREVVPEGWKASEYFGSQNSFFQRDGKEWARTSISRWVEKDDSQEDDDGQL